MPTNKVRVNTNPVANGYASDNEQIIEFSSPNGGGLISFALQDDGRLVVDVYRTDATVEVRTGTPGANA